MPANPAITKLKRQVKAICEQNEQLQAEVELLRKRPVIVYSECEMVVDDEDPHSMVVGGGVVYEVDIRYENRRLVFKKMTCVFNGHRIGSVEEEEEYE